MVVFLHVQNFKDKLPLNLVLLYNCNIVIGLLQSENLLQLLINLFIYLFQFDDTMIYWDVNHHQLKTLITKCFPNIQHDISKFHMYWKLSNYDKFLSTP
jgi:hypothetical protein